MNMSMQTFIKEYRQNPVDKIPIPVIGMQVWDSVRKKLSCLSVSLCDSLCVWLHMSFSFLTPTKNHENQPRIVSLAISTGLPVAAASEGPQERTSLLLLEFSPWPLRLWRQSCKGMQGKSSLQTALISSNFNSCQLIQNQSQISNMGHNFAGKFHIHFHLQLLTLCYLPSSKPMFYLCFNFQLVFDPTVLKTAKQIIYEESGEDGFVCFLNEPSARWNRYFS